MLRDRLITAAIAVAILVPILIFGGVSVVVLLVMFLFVGRSLRAFQPPFRRKGAHYSILVVYFQYFDLRAFHSLPLDKILTVVVWYPLLNTIAPPISL